MGILNLEIVNPKRVALIPLILWRVGMQFSYKCIIISARWNADGRNDLWLCWNDQLTDRMTLLRILLSMHARHPYVEFCRIRVTQSNSFR